MNYKEAKADILRYCKEDCRCRDDEMCRECSAYFALMAIELQIPKKPIENDEMQRFDCPRCGNRVIGYNAGEATHCPRCDQKMDWSEDN